MFKQNKKILWWSLAGFFLISFLLAAFYLINYRSREIGKLKMTVCNVGQGDAILFRLPGGEDVLIDGGPDDAVLSCLGKNLPLWDRNIELIVLTHPHADHVSGLVSVLNRYSVGEVLTSGLLGESSADREFRRLLVEKKIKTILAVAGQEINFGQQVKLTVLYPAANLTDQTLGNLNDGSVVTRLVYGQEKFLLMGDLEAAGEERLLSLGVDLSANVLKVGHHGSNSSSNQKFLAAVAPQFAVISVGKGNSYGHPSGLTLRHLEQISAKVLRTDLLGEIHLFSDGKKITINR